MGRFHVNEILSTVLLNFVSFQVLDYAATEVWTDPAAGVAATRGVGEGAELPTIGGPPGVHAGLLLAGARRAGDHRGDPADRGRLRAAGRRHQPAGGRRSTASAWSGSR